MAENDLHARLELLGKRISAAKKTLDEHSSWNDGHKLSVGELEARHRFLAEELEGEIKDAEAHGRHVSNLEASLREWLDSLSLKVGRG